MPQHADVPARDGQRRHPVEHLPDGAAMLRRGQPLPRPPQCLEGRALLDDPREVPLIDEPDDRLGVGLCRAPDLRSAPALPRDLAQRAQHAIELDQVQLLQLGERGAVLTLGGRILRVALEHVQPAGVQAQVDAAPAEQPVQPGVVGLAVLPARRDRRDRSVKADVVHTGSPLRPEQDDHEASTCTVRPTPSSIPRSTSSSGWRMRT